MRTAISIIQIITALALIAIILIQDRGEGMGEALGGSGSGGDFTHTKRGMEKILYIATIVLLALFALTSVSMLLIK